MPNYNDKKIFSSIFVIISVFVSLGIYYLVIANSYGGVFEGTLIAVKVNTVTSCSSNKQGTSCSQRYYIDEIFRKDNSSNTCTVQRLTPYYFKGSANNIVENAVLYTKRTVWTAPYNANTCIDITLRNYYNTIGAILLGFGCFLIIAFLLIICYDMNLDFINYINSYRINFNKNTQESK